MNIKRNKEESYKEKVFIGNVIQKGNSKLILKKSLHFF